MIKTNHILILVIAILLYYISYQRNDNNQMAQLIEAQGNELEIYQNKDGENVAKIGTFKTQNAKLFLELKTKDKETLELQALVRKYKKELSNRGSATIFGTETRLDTVNTMDTIWASQLDSNFILADTVNNQWIDLTYGFKFQDGFSDTSYASLKIRNEYKIVIGEDKTGFLGLGKRKSFVEITNSNPYTATIALKTYEVDKPRVKKFVLGPQVGFTLNQNLQLTPVIGLGVTYKLFEL